MPSDARNHIFPGICFMLPASHDTRGLDRLKELSTSEVGGGVVSGSKVRVVNSVTRSGIAGREVGTFVYQLKGNDRTEHRIITS